MTEPCTANSATEGNSDPRDTVSVEELDASVWTRVNISETPNVPCLTSPLWTQLMVPCKFSSHLFILYRTLLSDLPNLSFRFKQINSQNCFHNIQRRINFYFRHVIHFLFVHQVK